VAIAQVEMTTAFVHRAVPGMNRSATRAMVARPCRLLPAPGHRPPPFRPDTWDTIAGFARRERAELADLVLDPAPMKISTGLNFSISQPSRPCSIEQNGNGADRQHRCS
jgi:hypothetical protein